jgi:hypothetical protein
MEPVAPLRFQTVSTLLDGDVVHALRASISDHQEEGQVVQAASGMTAISSTSR